MGAVQSSTVAKDAKDTESPAITSTVKSDQNQQAESYAVPIRPENANLFSGGTQHTAGGKSREATFVDGLRSIRLSDLKDMHTKPCVREALMTGIGAGFGIGGLKAILGSPVLVASNWAAGSFIIGSFLMHEYCQQKRLLEKQGMKRAVEVLERKKAERRFKPREDSIANRLAKAAEESTPKK